MSELELRHLRMIRAVAEVGSLSKAAVRLGVSQPALTAQLQRLERRIGGQLFERTGTGVVPTDLGEYVLTAARVLLGEVDELMDGIHARTRAAASADQVRVGGPPGLIVPLFAADLGDRLDGAEVAIDIDQHPAELVRKVLDRRLDLVILEDNPGFATALPPELRRRPMLCAPLFVALAEGHPLAHIGEIDLADLAEDNWVMPSLAEGTEQLAFVRACAAQGFTPRIRHQMSDSTTTRVLVQAGAVTLAKPVAREGNGVVIRSLAGTPMRQETVIVWHAEATRTDVVTAAHGALMAAYDQLTDTNLLFAAWWADHGDSPVGAG